MQQKTTQLLLLVAGWVCVILGVIGVFLPLLPTTPWILLAAYCFGKSSPRFHQWIVSHRFFGPIIENYSSGKGIPRKIRFRGVLLMWLGMVSSMIIVRQWWSVVLLGIIGICVTIYLYRLPAYEDNPPQ